MKFLSILFTKMLICRFKSDRQLMIQYISHKNTYPFIAPPTIIFGSLTLNSKHKISKGDYNKRTGSIEWMSSKSQNTINDL